MAKSAGPVDKASGGRILPWHITLASLLGHLVIAIVLVKGHLFSAGVLLIIFGLMDSFDGALARQQKTASDRGVVMDAVADRIKEIILYSAIAFYWVDNPAIDGLLVVLALGASLAISYIKAKGEAVIAAGKHMEASQLNRMFSAGFMGYEVRTAIVVIGLLFNQLWLAVALIAVFGWLTALQRYIRIDQTLR